MFSDCSSLIDLNFNIFNTNVNMDNIVYGRSDEFKMKIRNQNKNIPKNAFENLKSPKW